tara:strand:+ start:638 stop:862 length:225 start_codon:yes stop_codon:yes gene_type:complete
MYPVNQSPSWHTKSQLPRGITTPFGLHVPENGPAPIEKNYPIEGFLLLSLELEEGQFRIVLLELEEGQFRIVLL